jgi:hypothetical protein
VLQLKNSIVYQYVADVVFCALSAESKGKRGFQVILHNKVFFSQNTPKIIMLFINNLAEIIFTENRLRTRKKAPFRSSCKTIVFLHTILHKKYCYMSITYDFIVAQKIS